VRWQLVRVLRPVDGAIGEHGLHAAASQVTLDRAGMLERLPLVTLYLSERCNSRCITCDYWRHGQGDMSLEAVSHLLPSLAKLQTEVALISGGEPLLNPEWAAIAQLLRSKGLKLWLLTSGLSLAKHARRAAQLFDTITVSLDGTNRGTYAAIRGLDAFDKVCEGIQAVAAAGASAGVRVTLQRANYGELPGFVELARQLGARYVSFLAVDVANHHAFGREQDPVPDLALREEDLPVLGHLLDALERDYAADFRSGFIAESSQKLWRIHQYFAAVRGLMPYPPVRCNAPEFSAVVGARGNVSPCFFIAGSRHATALPDLEATLNGAPLVGLRHSIRAGERPECARCVCSMWRDPQQLSAAQLLARSKAEGLL
jgi:MoaA/NifB/PqqE/SkfB family radical SAM enzyme